MNHGSVSASTDSKEWRTHKVTPIFKSGDRSSIVNYRPISLHCIISKGFERIVYDNVYDHLVDNIIS
uniref:Reverse transcriptase domain-containing protein n=1 Tax=Amphimedon queenslandica TaxID=400682 RepID=A0A1X7VSY8_AMPQE